MPSTFWSYGKPISPFKAAKPADVEQLLHYVHLAEHATLYSVLKADTDVAENEPEDEFELTMDMEQHNS